MLKTMYYCGLRVSEVCKLTKDAVEDNQLLIFHSKCDKSRNVNAPEWLISEIRAVSDGHKGPLCFVSSTGKAIATCHLQHKLARLADRLGIARRKMHPHTFRHTYATRLVEAGMILPRVAKRLGHTEIKTTMVYVHLADTISDAERELWSS